MPFPSSALDTPNSDFTRSLDSLGKEGWGASQQPPTVYGQNSQWRTIIGTDTCLRSNTSATGTLAFNSWKAAKKFEAYLSMLSILDGTGSF